MPTWTIAQEQGTSLRPYRRDFGMTVGDEPSLVFKIVVSDTAPTVTPVDITGALVTWRAWRRGCRTLLIAKEVGSGILLTTPLSGILTVSFTEDDTLDIEPGILDWQLRLTVSPNVSVAAGGSMALRALVGEVDPATGLLLGNDVLVL